MLRAFVVDPFALAGGTTIDTEGKRSAATTQFLEDRPDGGQPKKFLRPCTLLLLKESPAHGYDLLDRLAAFGFGRDPGGLYRALRALEGDGLVRSHWQTSENGHERRTYVLTTEGEQWLHSWASTLEGSRRLLDRFLGRYEEAIQIRTVNLESTPSRVMKNDPSRLRNVLPTPRTLLNHPRQGQTAMSESQTGARATVR